VDAGHGCVAQGARSRRNRVSQILIFTPAVYDSIRVRTITARTPSHHSHAAARAPSGHGATATREGRADVEEIVGVFTVLHSRVNISATFRMRGQAVAARMAGRIANARGTDVTCALVWRG